MLLIDLGNTRMKVLLIGKGGRKRGDILTSKLIKGSLEEFMDRLIDEEDLDTVMVSSVVPGLNVLLKEVIRERTGLETHFLDASTETGITIKVRNPEELGSDRIAGAVAAWTEAGDSAIVIDSGSATTLTVVTGRGELLGGAILPGPVMMAKALNMETGKLPLVELRRPEGALGRDTENSIISGIIHGTAGAVERLAGLIQKDIGKAELFLTGGNASLLMGVFSSSFRYREDLVLRGLEIIVRRLYSE